MKNRPKSITDNKYEIFFELCKHQLKSFFNYDFTLPNYSSEIVNKTLFNLSYSKNKHYISNLFDNFHTVQNSIFLYYFSNIAYSNNDIKLAKRLYYLNKILHSVDWFYEIYLPDIFSAEHPIGSVLGRAEYSDYFYFYQGVTVGGNKKKYPKLGNRVLLYSDSKILGDSIIGDNVIISNNTTIKDTNIPNNSIVFSDCSGLKIVNKSEEYMLNKFNEIWK